PFGAHDAREDASEPGSGRPDPCPSVRSERVGTSQRRRPVAAPNVEERSRGSLPATLLETKEFVEKLPSRINRVLELVASNELKVRVDAVDEQVLLEVLHKIANRIALGVVLAAMIVGAAMLMQVPTDFRIFGYPGLPMIFFLEAGAGGTALVVSIL